jgi:hypothetical protein
MQGPLKQPSLGCCSCRSIEEIGLSVVDFGLTEAMAKSDNWPILGQDTEHVNNVAHGIANMHNSVPRPKT